MIDEIKNKIKIEDLLAKLKIKPNGSGFIHSLLKEDKTASLKIYSDNNKFYDFSTCKGGDVIDFYSMYYKIDTKTAIKELAEMFGLAKTAFRKGHKRLALKVSVNNFNKIEQGLFEERACIMEVEGGLSREEAERYAMQDVKLFIADIRKKVLQVFFDFETMAESKDVYEYLIGRGLSHETISHYKLFGISNSSKTIEHLTSRFTKYELATSGLFKNNYFIFTKHKIIIPYVEQGQFVFMKARNQNGATPKYKGLSGVSAKKFYNVDVLKNTNKVIIVEGEFDALKIMQDTGNPSIAVQGVGNIPDLTCLKGKIIYLLFDNDEAGDTAGEKFFNKLKQLNIEVHLLRITSNVNDISELL